MIRTSRRVLAMVWAVVTIVMGVTAVAAGGLVRVAPARAATATATATGTTSDGPAAETYGLADAQGQFAGCVPTVVNCCDARAGECSFTATEGSFASPVFRNLITPASAHRISQIRLFAPYDTLMEWNGSTTAPGCAYSRALSEPWIDGGGRLHAAGEAWRDLMAGIIEARAEGLTPVIAITGYGSPEAKPSWDAPAPDPTTVGGFWEYRCGVEGILDAVSTLPAWEQPHTWEAFNEPDGFAVYRSLDGAQAQSCSVGAVAQPSGAAKAACDYVIADGLIHGFAGHGEDTVIAGTFIHPDVGYLADYAAQLRRQLPGAGFPAVWSVHDYADVNAVGAGSGSSSGSGAATSNSEPGSAGTGAGAAATQLAPFDVALAADTGGRATQLWVTESGVLLTDKHAGGRCPATGPDAADTLGACLSGDPGRQAAAAQTFFDLPSAGSAVPITHLFWYQFQSGPNWDSGLVDEAGVGRAAWCVFYGAGTCTGDPDAG